jgi:hypothetical protein
MTKEQALQLGRVLPLWGGGEAVEARNALGADVRWFPCAGGL